MRKIYNAKDYDGIEKFVIAEISGDGGYYVPLSGGPLHTYACNDLDGYAAHFYGYKNRRTARRRLQKLEGGAE